MFPLYTIIDTDVCAARGFDPSVLCDAFLAGGARLIQLRDKRPGTRARLELADQLVSQCGPRGAQLIVNDYADIARLSGAAGVHVGQDDLHVEDARAFLGPEAIIGVSTHDAAQIDAAATTSASYIAVGPIYATTTKETGYSARGLELVRRAATTGKPVVAIGGITLERAAEVLAAGAASVAVISDLLTGDPEARVRTFLRRLSA